jgi:predicted dehydrogenase/threonine dehydrogenase-like Zn-dependent dehydrogenase
MKQVTQNLKTGKTQVINTPIPTVQPGFLLVKTGASLVSVGTERSLVDFAEKSLFGKARARPDLMKQILDKARKEGIRGTLESAMNRLDQPLLLGYSSAGTVIEVGSEVTGFQPGDRVACAGGGFAVHAEYALIPKNLAAKIPEGIDLESAAFSTIGSIALNGIRLAAPQIGESVAVIGLGLLGLITAKLVQANGCFVCGSDISPERIKFAKSLGFSAFQNKSILKNSLSLSRGRGFDHVLICADTPSDDTVYLAGQIARDRGTVISLGVVGLGLPRKLFYEKELSFRVSRSSGPGRYDAEYENMGKDYPIGYVRWTEGRNLEAFLDLIDAGKLDMQPLITHRFPIETAESAYKLITGKTDSEYLGILLTYSSKIPERRKKPKQQVSRENAGSDEVHLGVIGAGNYAGAVFLPKVKKAGGVTLEKIASITGISAQHAGEKFGFHSVVSNPKDVIEDSLVNTVAILTRHDTHAGLTLNALKQGKNVYCEKPLGINREEIEKIENFYKRKSNPFLMVGYNRRFAPLAIKLKEFFDNRNEPMHMLYRVNAGYLPPDHWLNVHSLGGGRLIGEGCHFIDFAVFLTEEKPINVEVVALPNEGIYSNDNFQISLQFSGGSIASIQYFSNGSKLLPKEYAEVFCCGRTGILDNFRRLELFGSDAREVLHSRFHQDKGHLNAWKTFIQAVKSGQENPIQLEEIFTVQYTVLAADLALRTGEKVNIPEFIRSA